VSTGKALILFVVGFLLALLVFPVAWSASALLGYVFGVVAIAIGIWLAAKRAGRTLPLVLGLVLVVIALISLASTAFMHVALYTTKEALEEATKTEYVSAVVGQPVTVEGWKVTVLGVKEAKYLKSGDAYYSAKEGEKIVAVTLRIENVEKKTRSLSEVWSFVLVTNINRSYECSYTFNLEPLWEVTETVKAGAVKYRELNLFGDLAPKTYTEGDILFIIPQNEHPAKLHFKVGIIGPTEVEVKLP